jgi:hypothetical protein
MMARSGVERLEPATLPDGFEGGPTGREALGVGATREGADGVGKLSADILHAGGAGTEDRLRTLHETGKVDVHGTTQAAKLSTARLRTLR